MSICSESSPSSSSRNQYHSSDDDHNKTFHARMPDLFTAATPRFKQSLLTIKESNDVKNKSPFILPLRPHKKNKNRQKVKTFLSDDTNPSISTTGYQAGSESSKLSLRKRPKNVEVDEVAEKSASTSEENIRPR